MATETKIGSLVIDLQIKTAALEKGLETAKKRIQEIEKSNTELQQSNKNVEQSYVAMAVVATATLLSIKNIVSSSIKEYNSYTQAMASLSDVANSTNQDLDKMANLMDKYATYLTKADIATVIKNFSLMGFTAEQTDKMLEALTNSAIRNRNANYTVSEAVRVASEGYRQGLSTLSDSAGVTENLSVMQDKYAKSIGKTAAQLTQEEINQAYLNRTMESSAPFMGAMESYLDSLAGKQGEYSQAMRDTKVAYGEAMEPVISEFLQIGKGLLQTLQGIIETNSSATTGITTFIAVLGTLLLTITAVKKGFDILKTSIITADTASKGFMMTVKANPLLLIVTGLSLAAGAYATYSASVEEATQKQAELNAKIAEHNEIMNSRIDVSNTALEDVAKGRLEQLEKYTEMYKELQDLNITTNYMEDIIPQLGDPEMVEKWKQALKETKIEAFNLNQELTPLSETLKQEMGIQGLDGYLLDLANYTTELETYRKRLQELNALKEITNALNLETSKIQQQTAASTKLEVTELQKYLDTIKAGQKGTAEYQTAVAALAKAYPEAANAEGILIDIAQDYINVANRKADADWVASQTAINGNIAIIQTYVDMVNAAQNSTEEQEKLASTLGISYDRLLPTLTSALNILQSMAGYTPTQVPNIAPKTTKSSYSSYSNKALDNYKKQIEYKKSLDQISLNDEINMYQYALNRYAKTQDERQELTTKVYELRKELQNKELNDYTAQIEYERELGRISAEQEIERYQYAYNNYAKTQEQRRELELKLYQLRQQLDADTLEKMKEQAEKERKLLNQKTSDYEDYIKEQKNLKGAEYDVKEQEADLNKIIKLHRNYLEKLTQDERYSLEERESIYKEELDIIASYEEQKRELRVQAINDTVSQLKSAILKQIDETQKADEEAIQKNIDLIEAWKNTRIDAINEEYNARIKTIQDELNALDKAEEERNRQEEDSEYERKKRRLEELVAFEHDQTTKLNYQKELEKLMQEQQKTINSRELEDRKEALKNQESLLKTEQQGLVNAIEEQADKEKNAYQSQLEEIKEFYDSQKSIAQDTAEKMLLNASKNQQQIIDLIKSYGNAYETTGQSLGEKMAQGINKGIGDSIQSIIQKVQDSIDKSIEKQIASWASGAYTYEKATAKPQSISKETNIYQTNYIEQTPDMPSETYRKLNNISKELATELRM
ncbi:MAG: hypothetical protein LBL91_06320 [Lachnospiraceae bacterium]|nr:hypothetical protein [Lachnospiraceae bacterium]